MPDGWNTAIFHTTSDRRPRFAPQLTAYDWLLFQVPLPDKLVRAFDTHRQVSCPTTGPCAGRDVAEVRSPRIEIAVPHTGIGQGVSGRMYDHFSIEFDRCDRLAACAQCVRLGDQDFGIARGQLLADIELYLETHPTDVHREAPWPVLDEPEPDQDRICRIHETSQLPRSCDLTDAGFRPAKRDPAHDRDGCATIVL